LSELSRELPIRPGAVRVQEPEQATFLGSFLRQEQLRRASDELEDLDPRIHVGLAGGVVGGDPVADLFPLVTPLGGLPVEELDRGPPVELVEVHRIESALDPLRLGLQWRDRLLVETALLVVALAGRVLDPLDDLFIELKDAQSFRELLVEDLLGDVGRLAAALVARAAGAGVLALLPFADREAPSVTASWQFGLPVWDPARTASHLSRDITFA